MNNIDILEEKEKRALENVKSLLLYSSEHEYFSPFKEEEIDDMNIVLNLVSTLIAENKEKDEEIENQDKTIDRLVKEQEEREKYTHQLETENKELKEKNNELEVINKIQEYRISVIDERELISKSKVVEEIDGKFKEAKGLYERGVQPQAQYTMKLLRDLEQSLLGKE